MASRRRRRLTEGFHKGRDGYFVSRRSLPLRNNSLTDVFRRKRDAFKARDVRLDPMKSVIPARPSSFLRTRVARRVVARPAESFTDRLVGKFAPTEIRALEPKQLTVCAARAMRREVLHAFKIAGKSGLGGPRYTEDSRVRCR